MVMMIYDDHGDVSWFCLMLIHKLFDVQAHGDDAMMIVMCVCVCVCVCVVVAY